MIIKTYIFLSCLQIIALYFYLCRAQNIKTSSHNELGICTKQSEVQLILRWVETSRYCTQSSTKAYINTSSGLVIGKTIKVLNRHIKQYLGIPYAEPPVGSLRFAKPKPLEKPIEVIIDATKRKSSCLQFRVPNIEVGDQSEDCLFLNIWSPIFTQGTILKPVMFWMHSGALSVGSIFEPSYNGSVLATYDVVVVSVNYRLARFGFLYGGDESAPGNIGFYDQNLGMKWVRDNIHLFGGDRNQITIFGQSAGSWSVSAHLLSPLSKGLFKRAILMGCAHLSNRNRSNLSRDEALVKANNFAKSINCSGDTWLDCLRKLEPDHIRSSSFEIYFPVDGTEFLPLKTREAFELGRFNKDIDILAGFTLNEGSMISMILEMTSLIDVPKSKLTIEDYKQLVFNVSTLYRDLDLDKLNEFYLNNVKAHNSTDIKLRFFEFIGDLTIKCPTYQFAKLYSQHSSIETNIFAFELTHGAYVGAFGPHIGVHHGSDCELVFGLPLLFPGTTSHYNVEFSKYVMKLFTDFSKTGKPDPEWPKMIGTESEFIKDLNPEHKNKYISNRMKETCNEVWKEYF